MNRIRELRLQNGWRQEDLAVRLNTKRQTVAKYETEKLGIDAGTICALCEIFGVTADYLLCRTAVPNTALSESDAQLLLLFHAAAPEIQTSIRTILEASSPNSGAAAS